MTSNMLPQKSHKLMDELYKKYKGRWVSISEDYSKIYAYSESPDKLIKKIKDKKIKDGLIMKIPTQRYSAYVG